MAKPVKQFFLWLKNSWILIPAVNASKCNQNDIEYLIALEGLDSVF